MTDVRTSPVPGAGPEPESDDFEAAWRTFFQRQRDKLDIVKVTIRLTDGGARPVPAALLATKLGQPVDRIRQLVEQADAGMPSLHIWHDGEQVWLDFATKGTPRFWYHIGDRRIGVGGCAPDIFGVARALTVPMRAEATCPVTGIAIAVDFTPQGVRAVDPSTAVVAVMDLNSVPEAAHLTDSARVDADVCTQQVFFANAEAAGSWLERHPRGRVMLVPDYARWSQRLRTGAP